MAVLIPLILSFALVGRTAAARIEHRRDIELGDGVVQCVAASADGKLVAGCGDRFVQLFHVESGERFQRFEGHTDRVVSVAFSPDGNLIASGSQDNTTRIWNVQSGKSLHVLRLTDAPRSVAFSPDSMTLVVCCPLYRQRTQIHLYDAGNGQWLYEARQQRPEAPLHLSFAPNGKMFAIAKDSGNITLMDVVKFGVRDRYTHNRPRIIVNPFEPDKSRLQRLDSTRYPLKHADAKRATHVAFAPDSKRFLSCGGDNTVRIWDAVSGDALLVLRGTSDATPVRAAEFSPDGSSIVSVTADEVIQVWCASDGELVKTVRGRDPQLRGMVLMADGKTLATCGSDQVIKLWNIQFSHSTQESSQ